MPVARIAGVLLLGLLALGLLTQITNHGRALLQESNRISVEIFANEKPLTETVDVRNLHLQIPIRATTKNH